MRSVYAPHLGRQINRSFGRKRPVPGGYSLKLSHYLRASLPTPPGSTDYTGKAAISLANIYDNDTLGDCVIAGGYHIVGVETANAGSQFTATNAQIIADYSAIGVYVPGQPNTDQGCDEKTALGYWTSKGFANGTKLLGWLAVDPSNLTEVKQALYLFENLYLGLELPDAWVNPFPSGNGFTWDVAGAPDPENGHCIMGAGYNSNGVTIDTWGMLGTLTWAALQKYCAAAEGGELYVMLTPDQVTKGQTVAPNGISWSQLIADFDALGGSVPVPTPPAPTPVPPTPTPTTGVTLAQAAAWATSGLSKGPWLVSRAQAESIVQKSLDANWPK